MADLSELIERLEKADSPDPRLDAAICVLLQYGGKDTADAQRVRTDDDWPGDLLFEIGDEEFCTPIPALTSSIDAAVSLAEQVLPNWQVNLSIFHDTLSEASFGNREAPHARSHATKPAIAICLATLRALQQKGSSNG